jgi:predicted RNA-binding protein associated with RNAse of E/G family
MQQYQDIKICGQESETLRGLLLNKGMRWMLIAKRRQLYELHVALSRNFHPAVYFTGVAESTLPTPLPSTTV